MKSCVRLLPLWTAGRCRSSSRRPRCRYRYMISPARDPEAQAALFFRSKARRPFDLARLPLLRFWLLRIREDEHWLLRVSHHILSDTWSWKVFFRELKLLYEARLEREAPPLPESEPLQYGDFAVWQRQNLGTESAAYQSALSWWQERLSAEPSPLVLPFRRPEPRPETDPSEGLFWWGLDRGVSQRLDRVARDQGATYYMVRLAAFVALLAHETAQHDLVLGTYVTNRSRLEFQDMFGFFANLVTLRLGYDPASTFARGYPPRDTGGRDPGARRDSLRAVVRGTSTAGFKPSRDPRDLQCLGSHRGHASRRRRSDATRPAHGSHALGIQPHVRSARRNSPLLRFL